MFSSAPFFVVALVALVPGVAAWWTGRRIARRADDPALPELLFARNQRLVSWSASAFVATAFLGGRQAYWGILLITASMIIGGYPLRRTLGIETDNLFRHLWRSAKSIVGGLGFWILLCLAPEIVVALDPRYRLLALALIPLLLAWEQWYPRLWLWLHDSSPLTGDAVVSRISTIVQRAGIPAPSVYRIGGSGTRFTNALAFPSVKHPCIGLGNALVELLEPDEVAAIYAHELSHIEQYSRRKIRRLQALNRILIITAVAVPLLLLSFAPSIATFFPWAWIAALFVILMVRGRTRKTQETESDARAAALCGDPEVVVRALIKVHVHGFIPRRWSVDFERGATHPSLARRIQALRGGNAASHATVDAPRVLATAREGTTVVFDNTRAFWFDGVPAGTAPDLDALRATATSSRSVTWPDLIELRLETKGEGRSLKATHRNGDSWSVPLDSSHVEPVQKALDVMDVRLHQDLGRTPIFGTRLLSALLVVAVLYTGEVSMLLVPGVLVVIRPTTAGMGALGVIATFGALLEIANRWSLSGIPETRLLILGVLGLAGIWMAWYRARHEKKRDGALVTSVVFGVVAAAALAFGVMTTAGEFSLVGVARSAVGVTFALSLAGLAAALVLFKSRALRWTAAAAGALALVSAAPSIAEGGWFGDNERFTRTRATATEVARVQLGERAGRLTLSPDGSRFLVQKYDMDTDDEDDPRTRRGSQYTIGVVGGATRDFAASLAEFADDQHLLALHPTDSGLELRLEGVDSGTVWTASLPVLRRPALSVSPHDRSWSIIADHTGDSIVVVSGVFDKPEVVVRRFANDRAKIMEQGRSERVVVGDRLIVPGMDIQNMSTPKAIFGLRPRVDLWELTSEGDRLIGSFDGFPECGSPDDGHATCIVRTRFDRGQVWVIERTGPPRYTGDVSLSQVGRLTVGTGSRFLGWRRGDRIIDVDVGARRIADVRLPPDPGLLTDVRSAPGRLAMLRYPSMSAAVLVFYRVQ